MIITILMEHNQKNNGLNKINEELRDCMIKGAWNHLPVFQQCNTALSMNTVKLTIFKAVNY
jgi:hypothetical protein